MRLVKISDRRRDKLLDYTIAWLETNCPRGKDHQAVVNLVIATQDVIGFNFRGRRLK